MIEAGKLKDYVTIVEPVGSPDTAGQRNAQFKDFVKCWAQVVQLSGRELIEARELFARVSTRVRCRWRDVQGVKASMRIVIDGRVLNINSIIDVDRRRQLVEMLCSESA
jgi:SPP1 family predicted phage head-tail adaptor